MRIGLRAAWLLPLLLFIAPVSLAQNVTCIELFNGFASIDTLDSAGKSQVHARDVLEWYPDGGCIVVGTHGGLWIYDRNAPDNRHRLAAPQELGIGALAVNPSDGSIAFSVAEEATAYVISPNGGQATFQSSHPAITDIAFSPNGWLIAIASSDTWVEESYYYSALIEVWDVDKQTKVGQFNSENHVVDNLIFSADSRRLLADGFDPGYFNKSEYWNLDTSSLLWSYESLFEALDPLESQEYLGASNSIMRDSLVVMSGLDGWRDYDDYYGDGFHIWDADAQERLHHRLVNTHEAMEDGHYLVDIALRAETLLTVNRDGEIREWNIADGQEVRRWQTGVNDVEQAKISPDGHLLALMTETRMVIWNLEAASIDSQFELPPGSEW